MNERHVVQVDVGHTQYEVVIGTGLEGELATSASIGARRAFMLVDSGLPEATVARFHGSLKAAGLEVTLTELSASEATKSLDSAGRALRDIAATRHERSDPVVGLGGGITGDLAGFLAGVYRRGVPIIQCPTTLLAMVDASVGGKTGVNLDVPSEGRLLKNFVGVFHQPRVVLADTATLSSLDDRTYRAGLAECVKHALISVTAGRDDLLDWTRARLDGARAREGGTVAELIARNVALKASVVAADERELGSGSVSRALLNLGHTFGHAIETLPGLSPTGQPGDAPLQHGEAVALGLVAATSCAVECGLCPSDLVGHVRDLLTCAGLPLEVNGLPPNDEIIRVMAHDKKAMGGSLRLVLPTGAGEARVVSDVDTGAIESGLDAIRATGV